MERSPHCAFRFDHPDTGSGAGFTISPLGTLDTVSGAESIRQAIHLLLSTAPGERVMRPGYGCDLRQLLFAPNDDTTAGLAVHYVRRALQAWEPRIELLQIDAHASREAPSRLEIVIDYRVRTTGRTDGVSLSLELVPTERP